MATRQTNAKIAWYGHTDVVRLLPVCKLILNYKLNTTVHFNAVKLWNIFVQKSIQQLTTIDILLFYFTAAVHGQIEGSAPMWLRDRWQ